MQIPDITVPLTLPFEVPIMLHPVVVHFAVVLPIVVLLIELANAGFKRRALSVTSLVLLLLTAAVYLAAYYTGKADGSEAFALLGDEAKAELKTHRLLGTYLIYALLIPLLFKLLAMFLAQKWARGALIVTLVMFVSFVFKQGHDGGELVYQYGLNVAAVNEARETAEDARESMADMNETIAEQTGEIAALKAEIEALKAKEGAGFGESVNKAVNEAVSKVRKMFDEHNASSQPSADENASAVDSEQGVIAVDENDTNGSI